MISNKEKRLSQAYDLYSNQIDGLVQSKTNHGSGNHLTSYGMINAINNNGTTNNESHNGSNGSNGRDNSILGKKHFNERNSQSLSHEFSQMYISNLKSHVMNNHSHTHGRKYDGPTLATLEEMNAFKKEALEAKKQMMHMEKSITYWSDCTDYWRTKWRKTRDEKNRSKDEIKTLKDKLARLENQLQMSEEKRNRLSEEVTILHNELSRNMYRLENETDGQRTRQPHSAMHYNSDRRVDYRKQRRKKETIIVNRKNELSSTEEDDAQQQRLDYLHYRQLVSSNGPKIPANVRQPRDIDHYVPSSSSSVQANPKVVMRNHERLFDKKIANRKRFSQVVMCDEDELLQFNQDIPNVTNSNNDNNTLKYSDIGQPYLGNNYNESIDNSSYQKRFMEHVSEEEEDEDDVGVEDDECCAGEYEEDSSEQLKKVRKQLIGQNLCSTNNSKMNLLINHSNMSTMATNSECANVGSIRADDVDEDSLRSDLNTKDGTSQNLRTFEPETEREGNDISNGLNIEDDEDDDEV
ncbi:hypothetical protein BLOT_014226 [Blomia tropicalis]|nr:hypothetical protein BLOT_014226 [Blomia tropicalis]